MNKKMHRFARPKPDRSLPRDPLGSAAAIGGSPSPNSAPAPAVSTLRRLTRDKPRNSKHESSRLARIMLALGRANRTERIHHD
jgi:hypothetical protein